MNARSNSHTLPKKILQWLFIVGFYISGCGGPPGSQGQSSSTSSNNTAQGTNPEAGTNLPNLPSTENGSGPIDAKDPESESPSGPNYSSFESLGWEKANPERRAWSEIVYSVVKKEEPQMLENAAAQDVDQFCPRFLQITKDQRLNFWGQLISAMSYFESGWNPKSRYWEKTMGKDPITGQNVFSEGLLQLSYQDIRGYKFCEFDWNIDKALSPTDSKKTILDPAKNLRCGVKILAKQLLREKLIASSRGVYWAVLSRNGTYNKISQISEITKSLSFCR